jgi:hypothetical protein
MNVRGSEQLYCSKLCRSKAGTERYKNNLVNKFVNNDKEKNTERHFVASVNGSKQSIMGTSDRGAFVEYDNNGFDRGDKSRLSEFNGNIQRQPIHDVSLAEFINLITENANNRAELKRLQEKVQQLEVEKGNLLAELDSYENEENEDSDSGGILSGIMSSYKTDPVNTISFTKDIIFEFLKPKTDVK